MFNLLARTSAMDNVMLPMIYSGAHDREPRAKELLDNIGLGDRLAALIDRHPENTETLVRQARRLADQSQMGTLFKVMVISQAGLAVPAFD